MPYRDLVLDGSAHLTRDIAVRGVNKRKICIGLWKLKSLRVEPYKDFTCIFCMHDKVSFFLLGVHNLLFRLHWKLFLRMRQRESSKGNTPMFTEDCFGRMRNTYLGWALPMKRETSFICINLGGKHFLTSYWIGGNNS